MGNKFETLEKENRMILRIVAWSGEKKMLYWHFLEKGRLLINLENRGVLKSVTTRRKDRTDIRSRNPRWAVSGRWKKKLS